MDDFQIALNRSLLDRRTRITDLFTAIPMTSGMRAVAPATRGMPGLPSQLQTVLLTFSVEIW